MYKGTGENEFKRGKSKNRTEKASVGDLRIRNAGIREMVAVFFTDRMSYGVACEACACV